ncbi:hypothetical protein AX14_000817 [Amanita brunnescens Koide BX004]|nr:hypothetical protein AX14_000817 [Amanita brunnescens Koide BX004]
MWRSLNHNHVLPFLGIYEDESASFLVSPYMKNGTLAQWRKKRRPSIAEIEERILEVARGMKYIHSEGVVHGDLRGDNILLDPHLHVKIADFGLTRLSEATGSQAGALHLNFAAPELLGCSEDGDSDDVPARTQKSDVYAFGCLYYEIHYDSIPFSGRQEMQILRLISRGELPPRCDEPPLSDDAWSMIQSCWARQASKRPAMKDIVKWMRTTPDTDSYSLRLLLCMLKDKMPIRPIGSNVNKTTVGLMCKLLDSNDYTAISSELRLASDAELLLDFILCLFDKNCLQEHPTPDITRKARRFMFKLSAQRPVAPRSLFITGVVTPDLNQVDYIGKYKGKYVALKVLHRGPHLNASVKRDLCREVLAWRSLSHKYILPLLGIFKMESKTFLVSPYMENGTLAGWRSKRKPSVKDIRQRVLEVAEALRYIHSEGIVHGDLRGVSILCSCSIFPHFFL